MNMSILPKHKNKYPKMEQIIPQIYTVWIATTKIERYLFGDVQQQFHSSNLHYSKFQTRNKKHNCKMNKISTPTLSNFFVSIFISFEKFSTPNN